MNSESTTLPTGSVAVEQSSPNSIRVVLADSQAIYRVGILKVFAVEDGIRVVAQTETMDNLYAALERFPTDVVLLEGQLAPDLPEAIREAASYRRREAKLIVQVTQVNEDRTVELYRLGVKGVSCRAPSLPTSWWSACARSPPATPGSTTSPSAG